VALRAIVGGISFTLVLLTAPALHLIATGWRGQDRESDPPKEAERLWELAIAAKGGRERLYAVKNLAVFEYTPQPVGAFRKKVRLVGVSFWVFPGRSWIWEDLGRCVICRGAESYNREFSVRSSDEMDLRAAQLEFLMESKWIRPVPVAAQKGAIHGEVVDIINTKIGKEFTAEFLLNPNTHLPIALRTYERGKDGETAPSYSAYFSEYAPVLGIQLPRRFVRYNPSWERAAVRYEINVDYDSSVFDRPARWEDGPEAWRPKASGGHGDDSSD
jgi:hypothetical protein